VTSFLREGSRSPRARGRFMRAGGYCRRHAWQLHGAAVGDATGAAIADLYGSLAGRDALLLEELAATPPRDIRKATRNGIQRELGCPLCAEMVEANERHASFLAELLGDEVGRAGYRASWGVCFHHLQHAVRRVERRGQELIVFLIEDWRGRLADLRVRLAEYDRKRSFDKRDEPRGDEQGSWTEVISRYVGDP
jgi:hypothetical protein